MPVNEIEQRATEDGPVSTDRRVTIAPARGGLVGIVAVPGDKSISHRAVLLGALSAQAVTVDGFLASADTLATVDAVRAYGVRVDEMPLENGATTPCEPGLQAFQGGGRLVVHGAGWEALGEPENVIDVRNAGTLIRLLPGIAAGLPFLTVLTGDASIRRRPMRRILAPLAAMGATVVGRGGGSLAPLAIRGGHLRGITHKMETASAQVKSCILLAGLQAEGVTTVVEPARSRDHTERMLQAAGIVIDRELGTDGSNTLRLRPPRGLTGLDLRHIRVPGDFSSAAFLVVAALLTPGSEIVVDGVGLNPTRTGFLDILRQMGADVHIEERSSVGQERIGRVTARTSALQPTDVDGERVANVIDELPLFLLAAARATGMSRLRGAAELRAKESDRLAAMAALLRALGVSVEERPDGMDVEGRPGGWEGGFIETYADHRIAMTGAVAGLASTKGVVLDDALCMSVSYPGFLATIERLRASSAPSSQ
jgi:3-phosphoshikimate 1-carboxyvinyltransferase